MHGSTGMAYNSKNLQVQTLGLALALGLEDALPCLPEIGHADSHPALSQGHQTGFAAHGTNIGTRQIVFLVDKFLQVNIF